MKRKTHHVLIVSTELPPQPGGIGMHAYHLSLYLHESGKEVTVITDQRSANGSEELIFDQNQKFKIIRIKRYKFRTLMYFQRILKTNVHLKKVDYVIATGKFALWNVAFCNLLRKIPSIAIIHGTEVNFKSHYLRIATNLALKNFDKIVAVSNFTKDLIKNSFKNVIVIPNGIVNNDWDQLSLANVDVKGSPLLTTVGRLSERKGQKKVIGHLPALTNDYPEMHYHCIGLDTSKDEYWQLARDLKVKNHLSIHGPLEMQQLKSILSNADIFIMLSIESASGDVEGFGIAILEANAMGIPAIGSIQSGIEDAINHGESGMLVDPNDTEAFRNALDYILNNKESFKNGAKKWAAKHDWGIIISEYSSLLE